MQLEAAAQYYTRGCSTSRKQNHIGPCGTRASARKDALQLEVTTATAVKRQVFFDAQTHLIAKEAATVGGVEEEVLYDDYRTVDGVKLPHKIELHGGATNTTLKLRRAAINGTVGERVFDFRSSRK